MKHKITIIDGHPDPSPDRFNRALVAAYEDGGWSAGHDMMRIRISEAQFPFLSSASDYETGTPPPDILDAQKAIQWADHLVLIYPLWLGTMPAMLKGFLEQVFRPGFGFERREGANWPKQNLAGRSARIIVTMGMPEMAYRWYYRAHSLKSLERNVLKFCGISPVRDTVFGMVDTVSPETRLEWLETVHALGEQGR